jgi:FkbM family methyltransferase
MSLNLNLKSFKIKLFRIIQKLFNTAGYHLISENKMSEQIQDLHLRNSRNLEFLLNFINDRDQLSKLIPKSKSQLNQDLFVLQRTKYKREGFFVEFGATNGIDLSNTYILETEFNWNGILAEPSKFWHKQIKLNRPISNFETECVWSVSGQEIYFNETSNPELSTINFYSDKDSHNESRKNGKKYKVNTISLLDLLIKYNAPNQIDYLSIDTEGSEYEILSNFDFNSYSFSIITCEHNYTENRSKIFELLSSKGYRRVYENLSDFDDWYVLDEK